MKTVIILGGDAPSAAFTREICTDAEQILCADSGLYACLQAGITPHVLIGDMDSIEKPALDQFLKSGGHTRFLPTHKDDTDGYAALRLALQQPTDELVLLGAQGGRFDHALANCFLLVAAERAGVRARMENEEGKVYALCKPCTLPGKPGELLSLLPLGPARVERSSGLAYPLNPLNLDIDYPIGMSNVFTESEAYLEVSSGWILAIHLYDTSLGHV
jgi:thiamine pyrophosphokinase